MTFQLTEFTESPRINHAAVFVDAGTLEKAYAAELVPHKLRDSGNGVMTDLAVSFEDCVVASNLVDVGIGGFVTMSDTTIEKSGPLNRYSELAAPNCSKSEI